MTITMHSLPERAFGGVHQAVPQSDRALNAIEAEAPRHATHRTRIIMRDGAQTEAALQLTHSIVNGFNNTRIWMVALQATVTASNPGRIAWSDRSEGSEHA